MNTEQYLELDRRIKDLDEKFAELTSLFNKTRIRLNQQKEKDGSIPPGIACKVGYDSNGRIIRTFDLEVNDLPKIPISNIIDLSEQMSVIDSKIREVQSQLKKKSSEKGSMVGTACKVNYDQNGHVLNGSDLNVDDIPELPLSKITGLNEVLSAMQIPSVYPNTEDTVVIKPDTACKVTYDQYGRIVRSDVLGITDLPRELITQINSIDSRIAECATMKSLTTLSEMVHKKISANDPIKSGQYTKVQVDSNGLVTGGDVLDEDDLPDIGIRKITGLHDALRNKADRNMVIELSNTVNSMAESIGKINEVAHMKDQFDGKVDKKDFSELSILVERLKNQVNQLTMMIPSDTIEEQLQMIITELSSISGRVSVVENSLKITNQT